MTVIPLGAYLRLKVSSLMSSRTLVILPDRFYLPGFPLAAVFYEVLVSRQLRYFDSWQTVQVPPARIPAYLTSWHLCAVLGPDRAAS